MDFSLTTLLLIGVIIFGAFFIRSLTGFGSSLLAVPLLALWLDLKFVIPFVTLFEVGISLLLIRSVRQQIRWRLLMPMILGAVIGVVLGAALLNTLTNEWLRTLLGGIVILFALNLMRRAGQPTTPSASTSWGGLAGGLGGLFGGLFGTSGPPYVVYLTYALPDKVALRASLIALFTVEETWRAGVFAWNGLIAWQTFLLALALLPVLAAGAYLGHRTHLNFSEARFRQLVALLLLISGGLLLLG